MQLFNFIRVLSIFRGARLGRYIIASTTAKYNDPPNIFDVGCDYVFACSNIINVSGDDIATIAAKGCQGVIEGTMMAMSNDAIAAAKKRG